MTKLDKVKAAVNEYKALLQLNQDIRQLSGRALAEKLETSRRQIAKAEKGIKPEGMSEDDYDLVQACVSERQRLMRKKNGETRESLLRRHGITNITLMEAMEYVNG